MFSFLSHSSSVLVRTLLQESSIITSITINVIPEGVSAVLNIFKGLSYSIPTHFSDAKKKMTIRRLLLSGILRVLTALRSTKVISLT